MAFRKLVDDLNARFFMEHGANHPVLFLNEGRVEGWHGGVRLSTVFQPVRRAAAPGVSVGREASLRSYVDHNSPHAAIETLFSALYGASVINLDRLCRAIHLLNFLPEATPDELLFVEVNPRHIISVKRQHGAYFEQLLRHCGIPPERVVIVAPFVSVTGARPPLIDGLNNYRERGYRLGIRLDLTGTLQNGPGLLFRVSPDFVRLERGFLNVLDSATPRLKRDRAHALIDAAHRFDTRIILEDVQTPEQAEAAHRAGIELFAGHGFEERAVSAPRNYPAEKLAV